MTTREHRCPNCGHRLAPEALLSTAEAADLIHRTIGVGTKRTLEGWRRSWLPGQPIEGRVGPEPLQIVIDEARRVEVRYDRHDVLEWLRRHVSASRSQV